MLVLLVNFSNEIGTIGCRRLQTSVLLGIVYVIRDGKTLDITGCTVNAD